MNKEEILNLFTWDRNDELSYSKRNKNSIGEVVENIIIKHKLYTSELEAKVYTYEKIIANSNFKAINNKSVESLKKKIKELEEEIQILKGDSNEKR